MADDQIQQPDLTQYREQYSYYARRLLDDLGLGDLGQPERGRLLLAIEAYVQQVMLNTLLEHVDDAALTKAEEMMENDTSHEEIVAFLLLSVPDIELHMAEALASTYARMLEESRRLTEAIGLDVASRKKTASSDSSDVQSSDAPTANQSTIEDDANSEQG